MEIKRTPLWLLPYQYIFKHLTESWKKHKMQIPKKKKKNPIQYVILILSRVTISAYDLIGCPEKKKNQGSRRRGGRGPEKFKRNQKKN